MTPAESKMREWRHRPTVYVREVLQASPDAWQDEVLEAIAAGVQAHAVMRAALKASKGPGKSTLLAWLLWWFLTTRLHPKIPCTSVTGDNLSDGLWAEAAKWQQNSLLLKATFEWSAQRICAKQHRETWFASARTWPKGADASAQADTLAGVHADNVMFLIDEAGGIPDAVVATAEAGLANVDKEAGREAILVIAGNPTQTSGPLYRACTRERALWYVKEISGDPDDPKRAPRVSIDWSRAQIQKYGRDNPWVLVNVFGQFPPGQSNALLGVEDVGQAALRTLLEAQYVDEVKVLGVDVARFGDDRSVLFPRQGRVAMRPQVLRNVDTQQLAGQVCNFIDKWKPDATFIDDGGVGGGVVDRCKHLHYPVIPVNSASRPISPRNLNRRAEMWWHMAEWVKAGGCIPDDPELISELTAPTYSYSPTDSKLKLESKADMKKRGLVSPDKADALALTFAAPVAKRIQRPQGQVGTAHEFDPFREEKR